MNPKKFYALIAATVLALIGAIWISSSNRPSSEDSAEQNTVFLPGLRDQVNDVDSITLTGADNKVQTTLKRSSDGWHIAEKSDYPADIVKLREFLLKLADASVIEQKTSNPKRYADLGVDEVSNKDAKGILVTLGGLKQPLKFIIGLYNGGGGGGTFVRRDGEAQSLLVKGNLLADKNSALWIKHELANVDAERIKQVSLTGVDGKTLRIYKEQSGAGNFKVADVPSGRELASEYVANSLGSGLSSLRADDVFAAKDAAAPDKVYKIHYLGFGGLAVDVNAWDADGKNEIQLVASNDAAQLDADITAEQGKAKAAYDTEVMTAKLKVAEAKGDAAAMAKAEADVAKPPSLLDPAKDRADRQSTAAKVAEDLNKTFAGWTFVVPAYEFANFNKSIDELLKPVQSKSAPGVKAPTLMLPGQGSTTPAVRPASVPSGRPR